MNDIKPLHLIEALRDGSESCFSGVTSIPTPLRAGRFRYLLPLCASTLLIAQAHAVSAGDITEDSRQNGDSSIAGLDYAESVSIGTISSHISGTAETGHNAFGIRSASDISIDTVGADAVVSASAARNFGYAIYSGAGSVTISNPIQGKLLVSLNELYKAASANGYGIYAKTGNIVLGGLAESGLISITTPQTATTGRLFGIGIEKAGHVDIQGSIAGTIEAKAPGSTAYGIWTMDGSINVGSVAETGLIDVRSSANAYGIYVSKGGDITIGNFAGTMNVAAATGSIAYGIRGAGSNDTYRSNINIGSLDGSITVSTNYSDAYGIMSDYGFLTMGDVNGQVDVSSGGEKVYAIGARYDIVMGDIGRDAAISAVSGGKDAFAIHAGYGSESMDFVRIIYLTVGDIDGAVSASAAEGYASALFARSDLTIGDVGQDAVISASSDGSAIAVALWSAASDVKTGRIDGRIAARSASGYAYGIAGNGFDVEIGSTGSIEAEGPHAYALYSGCYQGSKFGAYNINDRLILHAGASIKGIVELGGSAESGYDQITLLGGTENNSGVFDAAVQTTVRQGGKSDVRFVVGNEAGDRAFWNIDNQSGLLTGLTVNRNAVVSSGDGSLSVKDGGFIDNRGMIDGTGSMTVTANSSLTTGHVMIDALSGALVSGDTGLGAGVNLSVERGAMLGTTIMNGSSDLRLLRQVDINAAVVDLFSGLLGAPVDAADYRFSYVLSGNIALTDKLVVKDGDQYRLGDGVSIELASGTLPDGAVVLEGGTVTTAGSGETVYTSRQIAGSAGLWIAGEGQSLHIVSDGEIGYSTQNADIVVGGEGAAARAVLTGTYDAATVDVESGSLELKGETATLGRADGLVNVAGNATLTNNGTILSAVTVDDGAALRGSGTFANEVNLGRNASLTVGNSPGYQLYQNNLNLAEGASITFSIDGSVPAAPGNTGSGTYSRIDVSGAGHTVTLGGGNTINLEIGAGILNNPTGRFDLTLINYLDGASADASFNEGNVTTVLTGLSSLINPDVTYSFLDNALVLHGSLSKTAADETVGADASRYANALWSSTGVVRSFSRAASSKVGFGMVGKNNFWADGIGDFISMSGDNGVDGFDSNHGGYAFGVERRFSNAWSGGVSYGQSYGRNNSNDGFGRIKQTANMLGLASRYERAINKKSTFSLDGSFAYGQVENRADGYFSNQPGMPSSAEWDDNVFSFSMLAGWKMKLGERSTLSPFTGIEFINGSQGSYDQFVGDFHSRYSGGSLQRWTIPVGVTWQGIYSVGKQYLVPELTVAYQGDVSRRDPSVRTDVLGENTKFRGCRSGRSAVVVNAGLRWILNDRWSTAGYYNLDYSSGMTHHSVNAGVIYSF